MKVKMIQIECNKEELKANRGLMDAMVDVFQGIVDSIYGTYRPSGTTDAQEETEEETENE